MHGYQNLIKEKVLWSNYGKNTSFVYENYANLLIIFLCMETKKNYTNTFY